MDSVLKIYEHGKDMEKPIKYWWCISIIEKYTTKRLWILYSFIIDNDYDLPVPTNTLWYAQIVKQTQRKACLFCHVCDINNFGFESMCDKALKLDGEMDYTQNPNPVVTPLM